jgi:hypothetical protein
MYFVHDVEHFGLAFWFSEYPLVSMWVTTIVWFSVCIAAIVAALVFFGVVAYQYAGGDDSRDQERGSWDGDGGRGLREVVPQHRVEAAAAPEDVRRPPAAAARGRSRQRRRNDWASGDEDSGSEQQGSDPASEIQQSAEAEPTARSRTAPPATAHHGLRRRAGSSVR